MLRCWGLTERGPRRENQDAIAFTGTDAIEDGRVVEWAWPLNDGVALALLADGVGGSSDGRWAARTAVAHLAGRRIGANRRAEVEAAIRDSSEGVATRGRGPGSPTTTLAGLAFGDGSILAFNVGDTRIYSIGNGESPRQVSVDHRSRTDSRSISRFLGGLPAHATPSISEVQLSRGAAYLVCTDGLYAFVPEQELLLACSADPAAALVALVTSALDRGSNDNASAVLCMVD